MATCAGIAEASLEPPPAAEEGGLAVSSPSPAPSLPPPAPVPAPVSWIWSWGSLPRKSRSGDAQAAALAESVPEETAREPQKGEREEGEREGDSLEAQMLRVESFQDICMERHRPSVRVEVDVEVEAAGLVLPDAGTAFRDGGVLEGGGVVVLSGEDHSNESGMLEAHREPKVARVAEVKGEGEGEGGVREVRYAEESLPAEYRSIASICQQDDSDRDPTAWDALLNFFVYFMSGRQVGVSRLVFSLCGHILSANRTAPEPAPQSLPQLLRILYYYRVTKKDMQQLQKEALGRETTAVELLLHNPNLVVVLDGVIFSAAEADAVLDRRCEGPFTLKKVTLRTLLENLDMRDEKEECEEEVGESGAQAEVERTDSFIFFSVPDEVSAEPQRSSREGEVERLSDEYVVGLTLSTDLESTWNGRSVLSWDPSPLLLEGNAAGNREVGVVTVEGEGEQPEGEGEAEAEVEVEMESGGVPGGDVGRPSPRQDAAFLQWSRAELRWRSSFADLLQAYAVVQKRTDGESLEMPEEGEGDGEEKAAEKMEKGDGEEQRRPSMEEEAQSVAPPVEERGLSQRPPAADCGTDSAPSAVISDLEGETEVDQISLEDIALDEISLEPNPTDFYDSDTDSYLSYEDGDCDSLASGDSLRGRERASWFGEAADERGKGNGMASGIASGMGMSGGLHADAASLPPNRMRRQRRYRYRKVLVPSQEQLQIMDLRDGENDIEFELQGAAPVRAKLFVWPEDAKIVVAEMEEVVRDKQASSKYRLSTTSWMPLWGGAADPTAICFDGSIELFNDLASNGYHIIYIVQNGVGTANAVREKTRTAASSSSSSSSAAAASTAYLSSFLPSPLAANRDCRLPSGPILRSPESLVRGTQSSVHSLVFRSAAFRGLRSLFPSTHNPYHACFGANEDIVRIPPPLLLLSLSPAHDHPHSDEILFTTHRPLSRGSASRTAAYSL